MTYPQKEHNKVWGQFDKEHKQSIELGFNGNLTDEFYTKLKSVKRVRKCLKIELLLCTTIFILSAYKLVDMSNKYRVSDVTPSIEVSIIQIIFMALLIALFYAIYKKLCIFMEISNIREKRFKEYYEKNNK